MRGLTLSERLVGLRRGNRGDAVHKPLLLLLALSRWPQRWFRFVEVEADLGRLLQGHGWATRPEPLLPFWHLGSEAGIWELRIPEPDDLEYRRGKRRPTVTSLRKSRTEAGLGELLWATIRNQEARDEAAQEIADMFFEPEVARSILRDLRLPISE